MSELANNVLENLPYITAATGALAGAGYDLLTQRTLESERSYPNEALADVGEQYEPSHLQRIGRTVTTAVVVGGLAGGIGLAWAEHPDNSAGKARVEVVADRAGSITDAQNNQILNVINTIKGYSTINGNAISSQVDNPRASSLPQAADIQPFGNANMYQAVLSGLDAFQQGVSGGKSAEVVVTAHGIDPVEDVVSHDRSLDSPVPVYVVNVDGNASASTIADEKRLANQTGGKYLESPTNAEFSKMINKLAPPEAKPHNNTPEGQKWFETVLLLGGAATFARKRRHLPLTPNGLSKRSMRDK